MVIYYALQKIMGHGFPTTDIRVVKIDKNGNMLWNQTFGENGKGDRGYYIYATKDNGYIIAARTGLSTGNTQGWLINLTLSVSCLKGDIGKANTPL